MNNVFESINLAFKPDGVAPPPRTTAIKSNPSLEEYETIQFPAWEV